jgi:hypothetical protein
MVNSAPGAMIEHIKIENLSRNICIQHFENVKVTFPILNILFILFLVCLTSVSGTLFNITLI